MTPPLQYALVAYVRDNVGAFVDQLRREIHPAHAHLPAHITILPPRCLSGTEGEAVDVIEEVTAGVLPFEIGMGDVENFVPTTPTVFIRVAYAAYRMRELHDMLNTKALFSAEQWRYMPHLTIAKLDRAEDAQQAFKIARRRWADFRYPRTIRIEELTFVREGENNTWVDLAPFRLGQKLAHASR